MKDRFREVNYTPIEGRTMISVCCFAGVAAGLALTISFVSAQVIPPATVGVTSVFGHVRSTALESGLHFINPLSAVELFDVKTMLFEQTNHVPTKEGVTVELDVAMLFHVKPESVPKLFQSLGSRYRDTIIAPEMASAALCSHACSLIA
mmetsp:Transcript_6841/g.18512  ORF Transcript_6841/g.18512 Transcript_6841/m.18512 type:complete len:149 (-) Transcript_6841:872-1318(-)